MIWPSPLKSSVPRAARTTSLIHSRIESGTSKFIRIASSTLHSFRSKVTAFSSSSPRRFLNRIVPCLSRTKIDGKLSIPHRVVIGPDVPPSHQHRQVISPEEIASLSVSSFSSVFTLNTANGLSLKALIRVRSCGYMPTQGPHQLPEKVSTTTLPLYSLSANVLPSWSFPVTSGTGLPTAR